MLNKLSLACGGELNGKDVARNCLGAMCAVLVVTLWSACCYSLISKFVM